MTRACGDSGMRGPAMPGGTVESLLVALVLIHASSESRVTAGSLGLCNSLTASSCLGLFCAIKILNYFLINFGLVIYLGMNT